MKFLMGSIMVGFLGGRFEDEESKSGGGLFRFNDVRFDNPGDFGEANFVIF